MKKKYFNLLLLLLITITVTNAATITSTGTGNWSTAATWSSGTVPTPTDDVTIETGHTILINATGSVSSVGNLTVKGTLWFKYNAQPVSISGDLSIVSGGVFNVYGENGSTTYGKFIQLAGNLVNNGVLDFSYPSSSGNGLVLNGTTLQTISGAGTFTYINYVSLDNSAGAAINAPLSIARSLKLISGTLQNNSVLTLDNKLTTALNCQIETNSPAKLVGNSIVVGSTAALYLSYKGSTVHTEGAEIPTDRANIFQLAIDNTAGITLLDDLNLVSTTIPMVLTNGIITIPSDKTITCVNNFPDAGNASSFVSGGGIAVRVNTTNVTTVDFPLGSDGMYRKISFSELKAPSDVSTVRVAIVAPSGGTVGTGITGLSPKRRWEATLLAGADPSFKSVAITFGADDGSPIERIAYSTTLSGTYDGLANGTLGASEISTAIGAYSFTGYFSLASISAVLPVKLAWFKAAKESNRVKLEWKSYSESGNQKYIIQKSSNGVAYNDILFVPAKNTGGNYLEYDNNPSSGSNYYRLVQVDFDGKSEKLADKFINYGIGNSKISIYPNPVINELNISFNNIEAESVTVKIYDLSGKKIIEKSLNKNDISEGYKLNMKTGFDKGIYILNVEGTDVLENLKIVKN